MRKAIEESRKVLARAGRSFYDRQMTHHAAALTYYSLMSLFPAALLALSLLGLLGEYPSTYRAIVDYLRDVVPGPVLHALDRSLSTALRHRGAAVGALLVGALSALYGSTGFLEAVRRALNVVFEAASGRGFLRRKAVDTVSTLVLMVLVLVTLTLIFVGGRFARDVFGFIGLGAGASDVWAVARWPAAAVSATLAFAWVYYTTPDVRPRSFRWVTPGAALGVCVWLVASLGFSFYLTHYFTRVSAVYGAFTVLIVLVVWLWLSNAALLLGAVVNAEIERERQLDEGVPPHATLALPGR
ncbi:MAG: YihY/virulence factor BrkB family protein [Actinobacteria bacterium]|nr:MAG: YihY/virulence factor BrkB family protein [Actinomycetota bacterium]